MLVTLLAVCLVTQLASVHQWQSVIPDCLVGLDMMLGCYAGLLPLSNTQCHPVNWKYITYCIALSLEEDRAMATGNIQKIL